MNVLLLSHMFPPSSGSFVLEQTKALRNLGVCFQVLAPTPWAPPFVRIWRRFRRYDFVPAQANIDGFSVDYPRIVCFPGKRLFYLYGVTYYLRCRWIVRRLIKEKKIDLIHAHTIMPDGFAAVLLGREFKLPVVCTVHGSDIIVYPQQSRMTHWATRWALQGLTRLIAVSSDLEKKALALARTAGVRVIHNGADPAVFKTWSKAEAREKLGLPPDKKVVLFLGHLTSVKGVEYLLNAVSRLPHSKLMLALVGDGDLRLDLVAMAKKLGISDVCKFTGHRPHDEIPLWLSAADCLVLPSMSEGLPTVLVEAMWCRTPIIATRVGGIPEIVKSGQTGLLVEPRDSEALAHAIDQILSNPDRAAAMAEQAEIFAGENLTWAMNAKKTLGEYETAVARFNNPEAPSIQQPVITPAMVKPAMVKAAAVNQTAMDPTAARSDRRRDSDRY